MVENLYYTLSVKCTDKTGGYLKKMFEENKFFAALGEYGVVLNPSWFFKFSASVLLSNISNDTLFNFTPDYKKFAYKCHYVNNFDSILKSIK